MSLRILSALIGLFLAILPCPALLGAKENAPLPDLTTGGVKDDSHDWNLGPTGARGWIWASKMETTDARQILITQVDHGSPADGVLAVDDVILGVDGKSFESDARRAFGEAIGVAERTEN